jgi:hypothetical protein
MKKQVFLALPRLYLCLISCFLWCSCAVSRDAKEIVAPMKSYMLTVSMQPGQNEGSLIGLLADAGLMPELLTRLVNGAITGTPEYIKLRIHIRGEAQGAMLASWLRTSGIGIQTLQIESE